MIYYGVVLPGLIEPSNAWELTLEHRDIWRRGCVILGGVLVTLSGSPIWDTSFST